ncbi:acetyl-CoA synthetase-like protein, partial [Anaeromyces robustus]
MTNSFEEILKYIPEYNKNIYEINYIPSFEKDKILYEFNNNKFEYEMTKCYHTEFQKIAKCNPTKPAIIFQEKTISYKELDEMSNSLAYSLRDDGVKRNDIIPIITERSFYFVVGTLAIMKAGAAYLPIDPEFPKDRIEYMIEESNSNIILTYIKNDDNNKKIKDLNLYSKNIKEYKLSKHNYNENTESLENINESSDLCYVMFTSGTTGKPKGTLITHNNLVNYCLYAQKINGKTDMYGEDMDCTLSFSKFTFDMSIADLFYPLLRNSKVVLCDDDEYNDPELVGSLISKYNVKFICCVPSRFKKYISIKSFLDNITYLKYILFGGEKLDIDLITLLKNNTNIKIFNGYGPSETIAMCSAKEVSDSPNNIGKPLCNYMVYILDKYLNPVPIGVEGEIYIGGAGVGKGYLHRNELTNQKFIDYPLYIHPTSSLMSSKKIYSTGDLGKWNENGEIIYLGREDFQVKINGQRVELSEIENTIKEMEHVKDSIIIENLNKETNMKNLISYYICDNNKDVSKTEIKEYLNNRLPKYMIPTYYVKIQEIPITANGKLDKKLLPKPSLSDFIEGDEYLPPETTTEKLLCSIYSKHFKINENKIGRMNDFYDLGGDSISAIRIINEVKQKCKTKITIKDIQKYSKIFLLANYIDNKNTLNNHDDDDNKENKNIYSNEEIKNNNYTEFPMAKIIGEFFPYDFLKLLFDNYNSVLFFKLNFDVDVEKLENAFNKMLKRHNILSTLFIPKEIEGMKQLYGKVNENASIKIEHYTVENYKSFIRPYDISKDVLIRVGLIDNLILMISMNHLITDGYSSNILMKELFTIYNDNSLGELPIQYGDFSVYYNKLVATRDFTEEIDYFKNIFGEEYSFDVLPKKLNVKRSDNNNRENKFNAKELELDNSTYNLVNKITRKYNLSKAAYFLTIYSLVISIFTNKKNIATNFIDSNRKMMNTEKIMGILVKQIPIMVKIENIKLLDSIINCMDRVYHIIGFDIPAYKVDKEIKTPQYAPIFKFDPYLKNENMNMYDIIEQKDIYKILNRYDLIKEDFKNPDDGQNADYIFSVRETNNSYIVRFSYNIALFEEDLIDNILKTFNNIVKNELLLESNIDNIIKEYSLQIKNNNTINNSNEIDDEETYYNEKENNTK